MSGAECRGALGAVQGSLAALAGFAALDGPKDMTEVCAGAERPIPVPVPADP